MIGELVGGYRVTAKIGEGGMGVVYLAEHAIMGRKAAVKVLHANLSSDKEMVQRFFNEARAAGSISHPGIVGVFDLGQRDDGSAYIVMDYLEGESLARRLHRKGRLEADEALALTRQILSALSVAHARGIVHRDLKPDNIFIVHDAELPGGERIKLLDFGIAKLQHISGPDVVSTRAGAIMGTPIYMSPEQCRGAGHCDQRTDLYAVGVMLFELLTGRPPFVADALGDLMVAHMRDAPPSLSDRLGPTSAELEAIVATLLAKSPDERFSSGEAAIARIDSVTRGVFASGARHPTPSQAPYQAQPTGGALPGSALAGTLLPDAAMPGSAVPGAALEGSAATADGPSPVHNTRGTTLRNTANSSDAALPEQAKRGSPTLRQLGIAGLAVSALAGVVLLALRDPSESTPHAATKDPSEKHERVPTPVVPTTPPVAPTPPSRPTPRADALPPVLLAAVSNDNADKARRLHKRALKLHRAQAFEEAFATYARAVQADPGHIVARYNYACLLNVAGEVDEGLAVLKQLKDAGCPTCLGRLIRARSDSEWQSAWNNPAFIALTGDVRLLQPSVHESGALMANAAGTGELALSADLFAPRGDLAVNMSPAGCQDRSCRESIKLRSFDAFQAWFLTQAAPSAPGKQSCAKDCCRYAPGPQAGLQLSSMCTSLDSGAVRSVSSLEFVVIE